MNKIIKYLKNNTHMMLKTIYGLIPPDEIIEISEKTFPTYQKDEQIIKYITNGDLIVSTDGINFYTNPVEGLLLFQNTFDEGGYIIYNNTLIPLTPSIRTDSDTTVTGTSLSIALFQILKDFYNDPLNPLYTGPNYKTTFWDDIPTLNTFSKKLEKENRSILFKQPKRFLEYELSDKIFDNILKADVILFNDFDNVINDIKLQKPIIKIYVTLSCTLTQSVFESNVDLLKNIDGIFLSDTGYDFGTTDTNSRNAFNTKVDYIHKKGLVCVVDTENLDFIYGVKNNIDYPNTTWNENIVDTKLSQDDIYLIRHFVFNNDTFLSPNLFIQKMNNIFRLRSNLLMQLIGQSDISTGGEQDKSNTSFLSAICCSLEAEGNTHSKIYNRVVLNYDKVFWEDKPFLYEGINQITRHFYGYTITVNFKNDFYYDIKED